MKVDLCEWTAQEPADAAGLPVSQQPGVPVDEAGLMVENINYLRAHISRVKSDLSKWMEQEPADSDVNGLPVFQQSGAPVNEARLPVEGVDSLHIHTAQYPPELAESPFSKHPRALQNLQQAPQQAGSGILAIVDTGATGLHENNSSVASSKRRRTEASETVAKKPGTFPHFIIDPIVLLIVCQNAITLTSVCSISKYLIEHGNMIINMPALSTESWPLSVRRKYQWKASIPCVVMSVR